MTDAGIRAGWGARPLRSGVFCAVLLAVGLILFALPYPAPGQLHRMVAIARSTETVAIVGPSTVDFVPDCDSDRRPLYRMLSDRLGRPVLNLAVGGQETSDSINLAAATVHGRAITDVILPLAYPQIDDWTTPPYRKLLAYKLFSPGFAVFGAADRSDLWNGLSGEQRRLGDGYTFEGRAYPDYNSLAGTVFAREKAATTCPETETHDRAFTRSYFWWTHVAKRENTALYPLMGDLNRYLKAHGKRLHVVMLPVDLGLVEKLQPGWGARITAGQKRIVAGLEAAGVPVLDLSAGFPEDEFGTPWCACAHLNERGRRHLTEAVATWMST